MARLVRPTIDLATKLRVLLRQLGDAFPDDMIAIAQEQRCLGTLVADKQSELAALLGCEPKEIDYDHTPPIGAREKVYRLGLHVDYRPPANDPEHIVARARVDHRIKTNVKGQNGQHPDRVLIAKNRKLERREQELLGLRKPKPKAKIKSASRWPKAGTRKINWRRKP